MGVFRFQFQVENSTNQWKLISRFCTFPALVDYGSGTEQDPSNKTGKEVWAQVVSAVSELEQTKGQGQFWYFLHKTFTNHPNWSDGLSRFVYMPLLLALFYWDMGGLTVPGTHSARGAQGALTGFQILVLKDNQVVQTQCLRETRVSQLNQMLLIRGLQMSRGWEVHVRSQ